MGHKNKQELGPNPTYHFTQPCLGLFLQGGVKSIAIMEMGIQISMIIILSFGMPGHVSTIIEDYKAEDWVTFYIRQSILGYYYIYIVTNMFLTRRLYVAASTRNIKWLMKWLKPSIILYIFWFIALLCQTVYIGLVHITGGATWWSFTVYKLYSFWVVFSLIKEIKHFSGINFILRKLTDEEIDEFLKGNPAIPCHNGDSENFADKPHKQEIEIDFDRVKFDNKAPPLGYGAFGKVRKASLQSIDGDPFAHQEYESVAVKTVSQTDHVIHFKALLSELKILSYIGRHENIVNLVGACTSGLGERQLLVIVEFCSYGSIFDYLRANRGRFRDSFPTTTTTTSYSQWDQVDKFNYMEQDTPTTQDLIKWASQTAKGVEYIASKKVIHGDLAARNVLLTADKTAKIADFGLSRQLYHYSYFTQDTDVPLPWRWMAPEALKNLKFSTECDTWSYGVTIWEYFTLGLTPYECWKDYSREFVQALSAGEIRCERPPYATDEIYKIMLQCWDKDPHKRPTFTELAKCFERILTPMNSKEIISVPSNLSYCQFFPESNVSIEFGFDEDVEQYV